MEWVIKAVVRSKFTLTSRTAADADIRKMQAAYDALCADLRPGEGGQAVRVPPLPGVDPEMREWSIFQMLEHNCIVNRSITSITVALARDEEPTGPGAINPKTDVLPSPSPGPEQLAAHRASIDAHLAAVEPLPRLKGTRGKAHPVFGNFDAHFWHCMFSFHLGLHLRQAKAAVKLLRK